jgi:hypothetical protein
MAELASHDATASGLELALETLAPRAQTALICLAAFPSRLGAKAADAVLGVTDAGAVRSTLYTLTRHSLVSWL